MNCCVAYKLLDPVSNMVIIVVGIYKAPLQLDQSLRSKGCHIPFKKKGHLLNKGSTVAVLPVCAPTLPLRGPVTQCLLVQYL